MADFEVHPIGTARRLAELERRIKTELESDSISEFMNQVSSPSAIPEDQAPDEDLPIMLKPQAD